MADSPGMLDLQGEIVDTVVKNYAMENFTMFQVCTVVKTSKEINTYYEETDSIIAPVTTTAITGTTFGGVSAGATPPQVEHSWTEVNARPVKHMADHFITWEVANLSAIDVKARMLERIAQAIAHSVDTDIITELATTTSTAAAVATWDNATESLQQPLKDILKGRAAMQVRNWKTNGTIYIVMHPNNFMELMNNPVCRNAGTFEILSNGVMGKIAGCTIIVNNASTENTVLMAIGQSAMTWYEAAPLTTSTKIDDGIGYTIRCWQMGIPVLVNNYAAYKITGC